MDGFKSVVKMKCGGSVAKAVEKARMKTGGKVMHDDLKEDKKLIKKAFSMHDDQKHEGKTDLSGLKKGGRSKKAAGSVRKFKTGGGVKKMADGGLTDILGAGAAVGANPSLPQAAGMADILKRKKMAQLAAQKAAMGAAGTAPGGGMAPPAAAPAAPVGQPTPQNIGTPPGIQPGGTTPALKCGGKVKGKK